MTTTSEFQTSSTFLGSLCADQADPDVWRQFVERYGPMIHDWCRRWGVQQADADDVSQLVLVKLLGRMRTFTYDRKQSFRGWLSTVVRNVCSDVATERRRHGDVPGRPSSVGLLAISEAQNELLAWIEQDHRRQVLECALDRTRRRVTEVTWKAFQLTAIEEKTGAVAAQFLGISIGAVFQARNRTQAMIKKEKLSIDGQDVV